MIVTVGFAVAEAKELNMEKAHMINGAVRNGYPETVAARVEASEQNYYLNVLGLLLGLGRGGACSFLCSFSGWRHSPTRLI